VKLTKQRLKEIIKEELSSIKEGGYGGHQKERFGAMGEIDNAMGRIWNVINQYPDEQEYLQKILPRIKELAAALEEDWGMAPQSDVDYQMDLDDRLMNRPEGSPWQGKV